MGLVLFKLLVIKNDKIVYKYFLGLYESLTTLKKVSLYWLMSIEYWRDGAMKK